MNGFNNFIIHKMCANVLNEDKTDKWGGEKREWFCLVLNYCLCANKNNFTHDNKTAVMQ